LPPQISERLKRSETAALKTVRGIVVTSSATARTLVSDFSVKASTIMVATPGTDPAAPATGSGGSSGGPTILSVGSLTQRKDHALLVAALDKIADRTWQCRIIGSDVMDPRTTQTLRRIIAEHGLDHRIILTGVIDDMAGEYDRADIFALASRYEGYGMAFAEAMARGLPIIGCRGGAVPDLVPDKAGILVEPGDVTGFSVALAALLDDPHLRQAYAAGSLSAGRNLPDWPAIGASLAYFLGAIP
jgi:glycosyltransferase involved in cell wall biosynthesis